MRLKSPAAARNRQPILDLLRQLLPVRARVLEVASGSGEHAVHCASAMPGWEWQPSDPDPQARASIAAWRDHAGLANLQPPLALDVTGTWAEGAVDAVVAINLVHISPWEVTEALVAGAAQQLEPNGILYLYGPYRRDGHHTSPSNAAFDTELRERNPRWGIRDLEAVVSVAERHALVLERVATMPSNNLSVVFGRR